MIRRVVTAIQRSVRYALSNPYCTKQDRCEHTAHAASRAVTASGQQRSTPPSRASSRVHTPTGRSVTWFRSHHSLTAPHHMTCAAIRTATYERLHRCSRQAHTAATEPHLTNHCETVKSQHEGDRGGNTVKRRKQSGDTALTGPRTIQSRC